MPNILDYVYEYGHFTFQQRAFSPVDSLILSKLAYARLEYIPTEQKKLWELGGCALELYSENKPNDIMLFRICVLSRRFGEMTLLHQQAFFDKVTEEQFSAVTFLLDDHTAYAAFRGTDETLVGWKEDFNMAFLDTPAQCESVLYLNKLLQMIPCPIRAGGHSKGGNLAIYGAMNCVDPDRIIQIFSHDGPGFRSDICNSAAYHQICHRIHKTVPQSSVVGLLLQQLETYNVVSSNRTGIMQHDGFSWQVHGSDFLYLDEVSELSRKVDGIIKKWFQSSDEQKVKQFIDSLYGLLDTLSPSNVKSHGSQWRARVLSIVNDDDKIDEDTKRSLRSAIVTLASSLRNKK